MTTMVLTALAICSVSSRNFLVLFLKNPTQSNLEMMTIFAEFPEHFDTSEANFVQKTNSLEIIQVNRDIVFQEDGLFKSPYVVHLYEKKESVKKISPKIEENCDGIYQNLIGRMAQRSSMAEDGDFLRFNPACSMQIRLDGCVYYFDKVVYAAMVFSHESWISLRVSFSFLTQRADSRLDVKYTVNSGPKYQTTQVKPYLKNCHCSNEFEKPYVLSLKFLDNAEFQVGHLPEVSPIYNSEKQKEIIKRAKTDPKGDYSQAVLVQSIAGKQIILAANSVSPAPKLNEKRKFSVTQQGIVIALLELDLKKDGFFNSQDFDVKVGCKMESADIIVREESGQKSYYIEIGCNAQENIII